MCFSSLHVLLFKLRLEREGLHSVFPCNGVGGLTCAGHRRRVGERSVVAVLAIAAPGALAVVVAVRRTAGTLQVLGGGLVEAATTCCFSEIKKEKGRKRGRQEEERKKQGGKCKLPHVSQ